MIFTEEKYSEKCCLFYGLNDTYEKKRSFYGLKVNLIRKNETALRSKRDFEKRKRPFSKSKIDLKRMKGSFDRLK